MRFIGGRNAGCLLTGLLIVQSGFVSVAADIEQETLTRLDQIRAIKAGGDSKTTERYNRQMDEAWKFFGANKPTVLPILRRELSMELRKGRPNNMLLLDIGYY